MFVPFSPCFFLLRGADPEKPFLGIGDASFGVVCFSGFELVEAFFVISRFMAVPLSQRQPDRGYAVLCGSGARGARGLCSDCAWPARGAQGAQGLAQAPRASARLAQLRCER